MKTWKIALIALLLAGCGGATANSDTQSQSTPQAAGTNAAETTSTTSALRPVVIDASGGEKVEVQV